MGVTFVRIICVDTFAIFIENNGKPILLIHTCKEKASKEDMTGK